MEKKAILVGLNEINFEYIERYIQKGHLPGFKSLFENHGYKETFSEKDYHLLEPWIQWVSIHTGKTYDEHQVFRLGDIVERPDLKQLWEIAEEKGMRVGAVSPFNARNNLKNAAFFVPDPWTTTTASGNNTLVRLSKAVSNAVNNNANSKIDAQSILALLRGFLEFIPAARYSDYVKLVTLKLKRKATKAIVLDRLLADTFITLWKKERPDFSSIFLNAGAHIQHHYMFNSQVYDGPLKNPAWYCPPDEDPLLEILEQYDEIISRITKLGCRVFLATGLHQKPHNHNTFYWRLKNHQEFLGLFISSGIKTVVPRMSRDFLIEATDAAAASSIEKLLNGIVSVKDNEKIFEVDNRGTSLFVELVYPNDITANFAIKVGEKTPSMDFKDYVSFVAIKNGEHHGVGYFVDTDRKFSRDQQVPVKDVFADIVSTFG